MTPVSDTALDSLHAEATEIFTGAWKPATSNRPSTGAFVSRENGQRLMPDGSGPETINFPTTSASL